MSKQKNNANIVLKNFAREDFLTFCQLMPGDQPYIVAPIHEVMAQVLTETYEKIQNGEKVRIILSIPPRHGKTWTASSLFPAWALGKNPKMRFILATYGAELSEKNGMKTRDLIASPQYRSIFPYIRLRADLKSKRKWMIQYQNKKQDWLDGGTFTGVGMGGSVTGIGADCIILDDPHKDRAEAESKVIRDRVWEYFKSTLYSRLEGAGAIIVIMQRWHTDDLIGRLEAEKEHNPDADDWQIINFPAIADKDEYLNDGTLFRKEGEPLWPQKFPLKTLSNIRSNVGVYNWYSQYQQSPIIQEDGFFNINHFYYYTADDIKNKQLTYYTMVDPAVSLDKNSDEAVVLTIAKDKDGPNIYRIEETAGHMKPKDLIATIFDHYKKYLPKKVILESIALQKTFRYALEEEQRRRETYFKIYPVKKQNKEERIKGLIPLYEAGVIFHRKKLDVIYEEQLLQFPRGRHDDRIDAMSFALEYLKPTAMSNIANAFIPHIIGYYQE